MTLLLLLILFHPGAGTIRDIPTLPGFERVATGPFGEYLRNLPLRRDRTVRLYDGRKKANQEAQYAVVDLSIGQRDLQQCADVVMRLRAEFLFRSGHPERIAFVDNAGRWHRFSPPYDNAHLQKYLEEVFTYCNSHSLESMLHRKALGDMEIGDVFIHGGFPGHVVIVADMARNARGEKAFLLVQGYMPAQDIHVLNGQQGAWYMRKEGKLETPEYLFLTSELRAWGD